MGLVTMRGMVGLVHCRLVATNDFPQVALWNTNMGGDVEATIENLKAVIALASLVCYNELHNFIFLNLTLYI
mgnify:CR=1 FL=1